MSYDKEPVMFDCEIKDETDKAWLVVIDEEEYWIPKSISQMERQGREVDDVIEVPTWWAKKKGLA